MLRKQIVLMAVLTAVLGGVQAASAQPTLTVQGISMPPGSTVTLNVSGAIAGDSTFGVNILLEIVPVGAVNGTLTFTPEPVGGPSDIVQLGDPWPGAGLFSPFDTQSTFFDFLNGSVDDSGAGAAPVTFAGLLTGCPIVASAGASGTWDVRLTTSVGPSSWEGLVTTLIDGTVTVAAGSCVVDMDCDDSNPCTTDTCPAGVCVYTNNTDPCDDGDACTTADTCSLGACVGGAPPNCDDGNDCTADSCNPASGCVNTVLADGTVCGGATAGLCDAQDTCLAGTCQDNIEPNGILCRLATGECDLEEVCDGIAKTCPVDIFVAAATPCTDDGNDCTDDVCDGAGNCSHPNLSNGTFCGNAPVDLCDAQDTCLAGTCQDNIVSGGTECRAPVTECDVAESCDGLLKSCPVDTFLPSGTICTDDGNDCTADVCNGGFSCRHPALADGVTCGATPTGACDSQDTCLAGACQDNIVAGGTECRAPAGECDVAESCDGIAKACPLDGFVAGGTVCTDEGNDCTADECDGSGACVHPLLADGVSCGNAATDLCDLQDTCLIGVCQDNIAAGGVECRAAVDECDVAEACDGAVKACPLDAFQALGTACADDLNECTIDECDGNGVCTNTAVADLTACIDDGNDCTDDVCMAGVCQHPALVDGTTCGGVPVGACDAQDTCSAGVCQDLIVAGGVECRASGGDCDVAESCDGASKICPVDEFEPLGTSCADDGNECTIDVCDGNGNCSNTPVADQTACNSDGIECTADVCVAGTCQHPAVADGTFCGSAPTDLCDAQDSCLAGACQDNVEPSGVECRSPAGECDAAETCDGVTKVCPLNVFQPVGTACTDDGIECSNDVCDGAGTCAHPPVAAGVACTPDANECTQDVCDGIGACGHPPVADGFACGAAPTQPCDASDTCLAGSCQDNIEALGTECRAAADECDAAETCDGVAKSCPVNDFQPAGTVCPDDGNECSDDVCDGNGGCTHPFVADLTPCDTDGNECTNDVCQVGVCLHTALAAGTLCGSQSDTGCDDPDTCDGAGSCQANTTPVDTVCRPAASECDVPESCDGVSPACPANNFQVLGVPCTDEGNECTNDVCDGGGVCSHPAVSDGIACAGDGNDCTGDVCASGVCAHPNSAVGTACGDPSDTDCTNADSCDGTGLCRANDISAGTTCIDDGNDCTNDVCDGAGTCDHPNATDGVLCTDDGNECTNDVCSTGTCIHPSRPDQTACSSDANDCTNDVCISGACAHTGVGAGTPCGSDGATQCDNPDSCNGAGVCLTNPVAVGTTCGNPADTECDNADTCDGSGSCGTNAEPAGTACGDPNASECDAADSCNGSGSCLLNQTTAGTACGDPSDNFCTNPDTCNGSGVCNPNDFACPPGRFCVEGLVGPSCVQCETNEQCDDGVFCNGAEFCSNEICVTPGPACDDQNVCTTDSCIEANSQCINQADDAFDPDDGVFCNGVDVCQGGVLIVGSPPDCDDGAQCTADSCNVAQDACQNVNIGGACDDQMACTINDQCISGVCVGDEEVTGNGEVDLRLLPLVTTVFEGDPIELGLFAFSVDLTPDPILQADIVLQWEPDVVEFTGFVNNGPHNWSFQWLPDDVFEDDINGTFLDGTAYFQASALPNSPAIVTFDGLLITTFQFNSVGLAQQSRVEILACIGQQPTRTFLSAGAVGLVHGNLGSAVVQVVNCLENSTCDNGVFCDGLEECVQGQCQPGANPCDDEILCTNDVCTEATQTCENVGLTGDFDQDGLFCPNGIDRCENGVFVPGTQPNCDDGNICTNDSCNEAADSCDNINNSASCDDLNSCTNNDVCSGGTCAGTLDPDCVSCQGPGECNDGVACTDDVCNLALGVCEFTANDALCPDDGFFCTGVEFCDAQIGCTDTGPPCADCDEVAGCTCEAPLVEAVGSRYIKISPRPIGAVAPMAFQVTFCNGVTKYVGAITGEAGVIPFDIDPVPALPAPDGTLATLVFDIADALYLTPDQWLDVYVMDEDIRPAHQQSPDPTVFPSVYQVRADCGPQGGPQNLTPVSSTEMWLFGDALNLGVVNLNSAFAIVKGFQGSFTPFGGTSIPALDIQPCLPNQIVNLVDAQSVVRAFQGMVFTDFCTVPCALP